MFMLGHLLGMQELIGGIRLLDMFSVTGRRVSGLGAKALGAEAYEVLKNRSIWRPDDIGI
jgi:hypothetical protein